MFTTQGLALSLSSTMRHSARGGHEFQRECGRGRMVEGEDGGFAGPLGGDAGKIFGWCGHRHSG